MATKLLNRENWLNNIRQFTLFDDFLDYADGVNWGSNAESPGSIAFDADGVGGVLLMTTGASDNNEQYIESVAEAFKVASDKPMFAIMRAKLACVTDNQADMVFGFMDAVGADSITDASAIAASKHQITILKPDGAATLLVSSTSSASGTYQQSTTEISISEDWETYGILVEPLSSTDKRITFYHDPDGGINLQQLRDANGKPISHRWTLADTAAGTGELSLMAGVKAGSAEAQVLSIDYIGAIQLR